MITNKTDPIFSDLKTRTKKVGQPPGTAVYTGESKVVDPRVTTVIYSEHEIREWKGNHIEEVSLHTKETEVTWIHIEGLQQTALIEELAKTYKIHPLTIEDILHVNQRPKVEEFEGYLYITLKMLNWHDTQQRFSSQQISFILGKDYLLSFQEHKNHNFQAIRDRLHLGSCQRLRQKGSDYLVYRLMDLIVDYYFIVLEGLGDQIEQIEEEIISAPNPTNTNTIYKLKRQLMMVRKSIWPMRETINHLLQMDESVISRFTHLYLRDLYDHVVQAIDTIETCRDVLTSLLDMYLSSITNRMNEVMKTLTIIATIFIPITFIASLYGMNFVYMPELHWHWGYFTVLGVMASIVIYMVNYFRKKKWI